MAREDSLDARAEEILRILDETPDTPAILAAAALAQARDAGDDALRQQHLREAQSHIARIDTRRDGRTVQRLQAQVLALQGRRGDTRIAHLTPGEIVVPLSVLTPELRRKLAQAARDAGIDPRSLIVGHARNAINPRTGQMEFAEDDTEDNPNDGSQTGQVAFDDIPTITVTAQPMTGVMPRDVDALARMMISESTTETTPGLYQALGSVALNRVGNRNIPNSGSLQDVVRNSGQFQGYGSNNWVNADKAPGYSQALNVANGLLSGDLGDNTGGAVTFYSRARDADPPPGDFAKRQQAPEGSWRRLQPSAEFHPFTFLRQPWG